LGPLSPLGHVEPKAWNDVIAVNVTANWHLIRAMDSLLRAAPAGRAVFVTSGVGSSPRAYWGPYAISKAALDALARTYAAETVKTNVRVNLFNPGPTRTRMRAAAMPGEDPETLKTAEPVAEKILALCLPDFQETGRLYDYRAGRLLTPQPPA
jgi:NAD(P)-dependent dehydrogenase (short-subunit alcohol dehydrogenase family)